jgi:hypothetical protein
MSRDDTLSPYEKVMHLTPETTNGELCKLYSTWRHTFDKVSALLKLKNNLRDPNI